MSRSDRRRQYDRHMKFWMVFNVTKGGPPFVHHDRGGDALAEARRLASVNHTDDFVVLEAMAVVRALLPSLPAPLPTTARVLKAREVRV